MDLRAIRIALAARCQGMDAHVYDVQPTNPQWPSIIVNGPRDQILYSAQTPAAEEQVVMTVSLVHGGDREEAQRSLDLMASTGIPESVPDRFNTPPKLPGEPWGWLKLREGSSQFLAQYGDGAQTVVQLDLFVEVHGICA